MLDFCFNFNFLTCDIKWSPVNIVSSDELLLLYVTRILHVLLFIARLGLGSHFSQLTNLGCILININV